MNSIGGYFELELNKSDLYHKEAICLNSGRTALELILRTLNYSKVYVPYYICDVVLDVFDKCNTTYEFYSINIDFEPIFDFSTIHENEGFLYINYFGIKNTFIEDLIRKCNNLIIDNSQSFFSKSYHKIPSFNSCRKFFGVPDGAYLYLDKPCQVDFPLDHSERRFIHLLKRVEYGPEIAYKDYIRIEKSFKKQEIKQMSLLTKGLLSNLDYELVRNKRRDNYLFLQTYLSKYNQLNLPLPKDSVPMVYPFMIENGAHFRKILIENKVYVATYWSNVLKLVLKDSLESNFTQNIIPLPIDQRYSPNDLIRILELLKLK